MSKHHIELMRSKALEASTIMPERSEELQGAFKRACEAIEQGCCPVIEGQLFVCWIEALKEGR